MPATTFECVCCFDDDVDLNHAVTCQSGHVSCVTCIQRAMVNAVEEFKPFSCFHAGCSSDFTHVAIQRAVMDEKLKEAYEKVVSNRAVSASVPADNKWSCGSCDNVVTVEGVNLASFDHVVCNACNKTTCQGCGKEAHTGPCDEERRREEEETEKFVFTCACGNRFFRGDGCNHMTCNICRRHSCWICKKVFGGVNEMSGHFYSPNVARKHRPHESTCPQYGDRSANQVFAKQDFSNVKIRRRIVREDKVPEVLDLRTIVLGGCSTQDDDVINTTVNDNVVPSANLYSGRFMCEATTKKGTPCPFKVKRNAGLYCGKHIPKQNPQPWNRQPRQGPRVVVVLD